MASLRIMVKHCSLCSLFKIFQDESEQTVALGLPSRLSSLHALQQLLESREYDQGVRKKLLPYFSMMLSRQK